MVRKLRDLNAMVTRMATLADGGRITRKLVEEEIERIKPSTVNTLHTADSSSHNNTSLETLLGEDATSKYDDFDLAQLAHVVNICRESESMADAARKLFAVSIKAKTSSNNTDRLSKYLSKFGLKFKQL